METMRTAELQHVRDTEARRILHWRYDSLVRAGYPEREALVLAAEFDADLHRAVELVQRGCPPETAVRILL
jgi:hypothetical protein